MKKFLKEYAKIIGYTLTGLIFAYSSFYLFLNLYHQNEVRISYEYNSQEDTNYQNTKTNIEKIKQNLNFSVNDYHGTIDRYYISGLQSRLKLCVKQLENEDFQKVEDWNEISIKEVAELNQIYRGNVVNNCLVMQITDYLSGANEALAGYDPFDHLYEMSQIQMKYLKQNTNYISSQLQNNSSYSFNTAVARNTIYHPVKDNMGIVMSSYEDASSFVLYVSEWLKKEVNL